MNFFKDSNFFKDLNLLDILFYYLLHELEFNLRGVLYAQELYAYRSYTYAGISCVCKSGGEALSRVEQMYNMLLLLQQELERG